MQFDATKFQNDLLMKRKIEKKLTLIQLSQITGISKATLSRIENGQSFDIATFATLLGWMEQKPNRYFKKEIK